MRNRKRIARIGALVSSITLAGIYVGCQAVRQNDGASRTTQPEAPPPAAEQAATTPKQTVMPGSKSMRLETDPTFFTGSKSATPLIPPPAPAPAPQQQEAPR
jgi:hypothetical protein